MMDDNQNLGVTSVVPLTDRVNGQPPILKGLSSKEVGLAMVVAFPAWFLIGLLIGFISGAWMLLMVAAIFGPLCTVWVGAGFMAKVKRNRPDHYHLHAAMAWLNKFGLRKTRFLTHAGAWDLGRSMPQIAGRRGHWLERIQRLLGL